MEDTRGPNRGSYIWGRSVHNIRIERLWVDFTSGLGSKWKAFFQELEMSYGLDADNPSHIWLLHHLFLTILNQEIHMWQGAWNCHRISLPEGRRSSPAKLRDMSMLQHGIRGFQVVHDQLSPADITEYGVDWDAIGNGDNHYLRHHNVHNTNDAFSNNPFLTHQPEQYSVVDVHEPNCPLTAEQIVYLDQRVSTIPFAYEVDTYRTIWVTAFAICTNELSW
ncbi:hypothetical protein FOMPIDRAFT_1135071 [Fomitopsis schrenkii]|uniref:Integrase core domain-containing protein n=1 Tax=Fomitopsis schrenkii TaxID=2126942 RepID=S8F4W6_FOMSC|nr:hypothetical protein FOMPIDRAFT_1135071 [Fomitopsis schrenkii]